MVVKLITAITADGKIARNSSEVINWTSSEDKNRFASITKESGVVIMGANTFKQLDKPLPNRLNVVYTHNTEVSYNTIVLYTSCGPKDLLQYLKGIGYTDICIIGGSIINSMFIKLNLVDEIHLTIAPKLFGNGISLFNKSTNIDVDLELKDIDRLNNNEVVLIYNVRRKK